MSVPMQEHTFDRTFALEYYERTEKNAFVRGRTTVSTVPPRDKN